MLIGTVDWALIEKWQTKKVPLRIVIAAIDEVFDRFQAKGEDTKSVRSLTYCREAVENKFKVWSETQAGKSGERGSQKETPVSEDRESDLREHIAHLFSTLEETPETRIPALDKIVEEFSEKLRNLSEKSVDADIEFVLDDLDSSFDIAIFEKRDEIVPEMADFEGSPRHVGTVIRQKFSIPRFSTFKL